MSADLILNNLDVATSIISEIDANHTLAALARTSQALSHIALDRLWHTIESVVILARCMPQEYWIEDDIGSTTDQSRSRYYQVNFSAKTREGDWLGPRFRQYAGRIQSLGIVTLERLIPQDMTFRGPFPPRSYITVQSDIVAAWQAYCQDIAPLFTNLKHVAWVGRTAQEVDLIIPFIVPSLDHLAFKIGSTPRSSVAVDELAAIIGKAMTSTSLTKLDTSPSHPYIRLPPLDVSIRKSIRALRKLTYWPGLSQDLVAELAEAPNLQTLEVILNVGIRFDHIPLVFPDLCHLTFRHITWESALSCITAMQSRCLQSLEMYIAPISDAQPRVTHADELLFLIGNSDSTRHLRRLVLKGTSTYRGVTEDHCIANPGSIMYILGLHHLQEVVVLKKISELLVSLLPILLDAWPELEVLQLNGVGNVSLDQFLDLTRQHPHVKHFSGFKVFCDLTQALPTVDHNPNETLEYFDVSVTEVGTCSDSDVVVDLRHLSHFLVKIFPSARHYYPDIRSCNITRTNQVATMIKLAHQHQHETDTKMKLADFEKFVLGPLGSSFSCLIDRWNPNEYRAIRLAL